MIACTAFRLSLLTIVLVTTFATRALGSNDICVQIHCEGPGNQPAYDGPPGAPAVWQINPGVAQCRCAVWAHVPQADEVGASASKNVADGVKAAIAQATNDALKAIQADNAKREREMLNRLAEIQKQHQEEMKALIALLKAGGSPTAAAATTPTAPPKSHAQKSK